MVRMEESRSTLKILTGTPTGKIRLGRPRRRWEDNIRMDLEEIDINTRNWVDSTQDRDYWRVLVNVTLNLQVPYAMGWVSYSLLRLVFILIICLTFTICNLRIHWSRHRGKLLFLKALLLWRNKQAERYIAFCFVKTLPTQAAILFPLFISSHLNSSISGLPVFVFCAYFLTVLYNFHFSQILSTSISWAYYCYYLLTPWLMEPEVQCCIHRALQ